MGVFEHFPYVNYHELNLSWILRKLKELEDVIGSQIVDLVARAGVAENAQAIEDLTETVNNNAETAHNEASAAQSTANSALSTANTAQRTATSAAAAASSAQTGVNNINAILTNTKLKYADRTISNVRIETLTGYTNLGDAYVDWNIPRDSYIVALLIHGWSQPTGVFQLMTGTDGHNIYVMSSATGTIGSITVRIWYVPTDPNL